MSDEPSIGDPVSGRGESLLQQVAIAMLTSTSDGILVVDGEGLILDCNHAAEKMFAYPPEGLWGLAIAQLIPERLRKAHQQHRDGYQAHPTARAMGARRELSALQQDGREFFVAISLVPLEFDGRCLVCAQVRDVTWRIEQERKLHESQEELQRLKALTEAENITLREELQNVHGFEEIVGQSSGLLHVLAQLEKVAPTDASVLITGETGTGKELLARAVHRHSGRREQLFLSVNCASLPAGLVESELFGHEKGAFTGATSQRLGRFEQCDGGTLFLDEIGEMPLEAQAKVLRVLQNGEFERVGSTKARKTDVRVVAATNKNLDQEAQEGAFRPDLYHRLSVFPLHVPPLRERREDIPLLISYLVARKSRRMGRAIEQIPRSVMERLMAYEWPGNVRELENVLERAIILSPDGEIRADAIHLVTAPGNKPPGGEASGKIAAGKKGAGTLQDNERDHIQRVCERCHWKIKGAGGAAEKLGLKPATLYSRMKRLGIKRPTG
jgi:formate hydrogenlyase transcriptional activator